MVILLLGLMFSACSRLPPEIEPVAVSIRRLDLLEATFFEQAYRVELRLSNPNKFDIPVHGMQYVIEINGEPYASGLSAQEVRVPSLGSEVLAVEAVSTIFAIWRQFQALQQGQLKAISYRLSGELFLPDERRLAFEQRGEIEPEDLGVEEFRMADPPGGQHSRRVSSSSHLAKVAASSSSSAVNLALAPAISAPPPW